LKQYKVIEIPVNKLKKADWNYKKDDEILLNKLINNIKKNGQIENLIVRELPDGYFEVINGNHRLDALCSLGYSKAYCVNLGNITETIAKRIAIETNETKFETNNYQLSEIIKELIDAFPKDNLLDTLPFDEKILDTVERVITDEMPDFTEFGESGVLEGFSFDNVNLGNEIDNIVSPEDIKREMECKHCGKKFTY